MPGSPCGANACVAGAEAPDRPEFLRIATKPGEHEHRDETRWPRNSSAQGL